MGEPHIKGLALNKWIQRTHGTLKTQWEKNRHADPQGIEDNKSHRSS